MHPNMQRNTKNTPLSQWGPLKDQTIGQFAPCKTHTSLNIASLIGLPEICKTEGNPVGNRIHAIPTYMKWTGITEIFISEFSLIYCTIEQTNKNTDHKYWQQWVIVDRYRPYTKTLTTTALRVSSPWPREENVPGRLFRWLSLGIERRGFCNFHFVTSGKVKQCHCLAVGKDGVFGLAETDIHINGLELQ